MLELDIWHKLIVMLKVLIVCSARKILKMLYLIFADRTA